MRQIEIDNILVNYEVDEVKGKIYNLTTKKEMKISDKGVVQLKVNGKSRGFTVGKIIAKMFIENPNPDEYIYVGHKDGDKSNNKIENLYWMTAKENSNNTWNKRRQNGTTGAGKENKKKQENIVENRNKTEKYLIEENEKRIYFNEEEAPFVIRPDGRVRNLRTGNILKGTILHTYQYINFRWDGKQKNKAVHRLVAEAFLPNPENKEMVDHIDGNRLNNDISNLRWATASENANNKHFDKTPAKPVFPEVIFSQEELDDEMWKEHKKTGYLVSNLGRIKNGEKILTGTNLDCGYILYKGNLGHILVWETFVGEKQDKNVINHISGNKHDNRLCNLEEVSHQENMMKATTETNAWGFRRVGEYNDEGELLRIFANASDAARQIGIQPGSMRNTIRRNGKCHNGLKYRYIENET